VTLVLLGATTTHILVEVLLTTLRELLALVITSTVGALGAWVRITLRDTLLVDLLFQFLGTVGKRAFTLVRAISILEILAKLSLIVAALVRRNELLVSILSLATILAIEVVLLLRSTTTTLVVRGLVLTAHVVALAHLDVRVGIVATWGSSDEPCAALATVVVSTTTTTGHATSLAAVLSAKALLGLSHEAWQGELLLAINRGSLAWGTALAEVLLLELVVTHVVSLATTLVVGVVAHATTSSLAAATAWVSTGVTTWVALGTLGTTGCGFLELRIAVSEVAFVSHDAVAIVLKVATFCGLVLRMVDLSLALVLAVVAAEPLLLVTALAHILLVLLLLLVGHVLGWLVTLW